MKREIVETVLAGYSPISLKEMDEVRLMNRVDTKFLTSFLLLPDILRRLQMNYFVLEVNGLRMNAYQTMYLDTSDRAMYLAHHNGRFKREKIRVRAYVDSRTTFLEVKNKNNKGRTKKKRMKLPEMKAYKQQEAESFLELNADYSLDRLIPQLENSFHRTTLVNKKKTERLTIDMDLSFRNPSSGVEKQIEDLVVIELKQSAYQPSYAKSVLSDFRIQPMGFTKYCFGTILTVPDVKRNRFKEKIIKLNKIRKQ